MRTSAPWKSCRAANEGGDRFHIWTGHGVECGSVRTAGHTPLANEDLARCVDSVVRRIQHVAGDWCLAWLFPARPCVDGWNAGQPADVWECHGPRCTLRPGDP